MVPDISSGDNTYGLVKYLYDTKAPNEDHIDPHIVASWDGFAPDPGRDPEATLEQLTAALDLYVNQYVKETGKRPANHVWHCPVSAAPEDRILSDEEWAEVARRVVAAAGIDRPGDKYSCRWIAVRHDPRHIHIMATKVHSGLRTARLRGDAGRAQEECRRIEVDFGLRRLNAGDKTAAKTPTSAEVHKAARVGRTEPVRLQLRDKVRQAVAGAATEEEFFDRLRDAGLLINPKTGSSGDVLGYSVADPDDRNAKGEPVYYGGYSLAPDLTLPRIRQRLASSASTGSPDEDADQRPADRSRIPGSKAARARRHAAGIVDEALRVLEEGEDEEAAAVLVGTIEIIDVLAARAPADTRRQMRAAARSFERASRSHIRAARTDRYQVRAAARELLHSGYATHRGEDGAVTAMLLSALVLLVVAAARWHEAKGHDQQAAAARKSAAWLRQAYTVVAAPPMAQMNKEGKGLTAQARERQARTVRERLPEGERLLREENWDALAATLAEAEAAGHDPAELLERARSRRELDSAESLTAVMVWRIRRLADLPAARTTAAAPRTSTRPGRHSPADVNTSAPQRRPGR